MSSGNKNDKDRNHNFKKFKGIGTKVLEETGKQVAALDKEWKEYKDTHPAKKRGHGGEQVYQQSQPNPQIGVEDRTMFPNIGRNTPVQNTQAHHVSSGSSVSKTLPSVNEYQAKVGGAASAAEMPAAKLHTNKHTKKKHMTPADMAAEARKELQSRIKQNNKIEDQFKARRRVQDYDSGTRPKPTSGSDRPLGGGSHER